MDLVYFSESMQELQQHMITNELIKKLETYRKGTEASQQAVIANCIWILANMISRQKELKQFAIEHNALQEVMLTMELFRCAWTSSPCVRLTLQDECGHCEGQCDNASAAQQTFRGTRCDLHFERCS